MERRKARRPREEAGGHEVDEVGRGRVERLALARAFTARCIYPDAIAPRVRGSVDSGGAGAACGNLRSRTWRTDAQVVQRPEALVEGMK